MAENKIAVIKKKPQKKRQQVNFIVLTEFVGNKKLSELIENLVKSEINKIEKSK